MERVQSKNPFSSDELYIAVMMISPCCGRSHINLCRWCYCWCFLFHRPWCNQRLIDLNWFTSLNALPCWPTGFTDELSVFPHILSYTLYMHCLSFLLPWLYTVDFFVQMQARLLFHICRLLFQVLIFQKNWSLRNCNNNHNSQNHICRTGDHRDTNI